MVLTVHVRPRRGANEANVSSEHYGRKKARGDPLLVAVGSDVRLWRERERRRGRDIDECSNCLEGCLERNETSLAVSRCGSYLLDRVPDIDGKCRIAKLCKGRRITALLPGDGCLLTASKSGRSDWGGHLFAGQRRHRQPTCLNNVRKRLPVPSQQERGKRQQSRTCWRNEGDEK